MPDREQKRQDWYQEVTDKIGAVIPQLTQGDHTLAQFLAQPRYLRLVDNLPQLDLLQVYGGTVSGDSFEIRVYGLDKLSSHLQSILTLTGLRRRVLLAWEGRALNNQTPSLYVNVMGEVDMRFDWSHGVLDLNPGYKGPREDYPLPELTGLISPDFHSHGGIVINEVGVSYDQVKIELVNQTNAMILKVPTVITQYNPGAL